MTFHRAEELVNRANKVMEQLPGDFQRQDREEGTRNFKMFEVMLTMMKEQNENLTKMVAGMNQQVAELAKALANMPRPKSKICSMF